MNSGVPSVVDHHRAKAARTPTLEGLFAARAVHDESKATDEEYALTKARDVLSIKPAHAIEPNETARGQRGYSEMLAVVAHELRNSLLPIRLSAAQLGRVRNDEVSLARLRFAIERQVDHMSRLVGDLLDISRSDHGKLRIERVQVEMAGVVAEVADACRPYIEAREQHLRIELPAKKATVDGDRVRLVQIVSNLLENASKYSSRGGKITVSAIAKKDLVELTVTDRGIGISTEVLPHVFETFVQDSHAVAFNGAGLGIGLSVVRELVRAHGGDVVARSAGRGLGSQFIVNLPLADCARTTNVVAAEANAAYADPRRALVRNAVA
ncbi:MAG TPA: HAMP domain-containing sensor histidine kinase [Polyangia bacterium]